MRVAAVTMAYNEPEFAPLWARHYARELGESHCYVVDHGSDDGSLDALPGRVNVLRIPRSPQDDPRRARFLSGLCASLLEWYDAVLHTDVDELVLADPAQHADLAAFAAARPEAVVSAVGLNLHQVPALEPAYDPARPVGAQRRWARFSSAMCKPVLIRRPVRWTPGFHSLAGAESPPPFAGLFLFHLRYLDLGAGLRRLARTRAMPWAIEGAGAHQRMADDDWERMFRAIAALPRREDVPLDPALPPVRDWLDRLRAAGRQGEYDFPLDLDADELWEVPARFRARL